MPPRGSQEAALRFDYVRGTRTLPVNLLFLMPWILVYQLALFGTRSPVDNATAAWFRALLASLGRHGLVAVSLLTALLLCTVVLLRIREATRDRGVFGGMLLEGLCYGAVLGLAAGALASRLPMERLVPLSSTTGEAGDALRQMQVGIRDLGLAVGAGVFEELLFRGLLLAGLLLLLRHAVGTDRVTAVVIALAASAYLFADYHHWGPTGEPYSEAVFAFRFHAGLLLGAIYVFRGLGIAAFAHGFYDVLVLWQR